MEEVRRPRIIEILLEQAIIDHRFMTPPEDELDRALWSMQLVSGERLIPGDAVQKISDEVRAWVDEFVAKNGRLPEIEEGRTRFGIPAPNPRKDKPWPPEEDCQGCDKHKDGPHRFGCSVHGKKQITISIDSVTMKRWVKP